MTGRCGSICAICGSLTLATCSASSPPASQTGRASLGVKARGVGVGEIRTPDHFVVAARTSPALPSTD